MKIHMIWCGRKAWKQQLHPSICEFPSQAFYDGKLVTADSVRKRRSQQDLLRDFWPGRGGAPRVFCHVSGREETLSVKSDEGSEMSKSNNAEIKYVIHMVKKMLNCQISPDRVVILSQYRLQCHQIEENLRDLGEPYSRIKVSTVVKSQGSEWDYVIISTVRSKPRIEIEPKPSKSWQRKHLGFINDENQMNVALTRAKRGLIIIGNQYLLKTHERWKDLLDLYRDSGCLKEAREFLS